jgi:hypothetical protein
MSTGKYTPGVRVAVNMGVNARKMATVVSWAKIKTDGSGTPQVGGGHYKPANRTYEVPIQYDDGTFDVFDAAHLSVVPQPGFDFSQNRILQLNFPNGMTVAIDMGNKAKPFMPEVSVNWWVIDGCVCNAGKMGPVELAHFLTGIADKKL